MRNQKIEKVEHPNVAQDSVERNLYIHTPGDKLATVDEVKKARSELESAINALVRNFEMRSGLVVYEISVRPADISRPAYWKVEVRI